MKFDKSRILTYIGWIGGLLQYLAVSGLKLPESKKEISSFILGLTIAIMGYIAKGDDKADSETETVQSKGKIITPVVVAIVLLTATWATAVTFGWDYSQNPQAVATSFNLYLTQDCTQPLVATPIAIPAAQSTGNFSQEFIVANTAFTPNVIYCATLTALAADGGESLPSNTVQFQVQKPNPPQNLHRN